LISTSDIQPFLERFLQGSCGLIDVRSPAEFAQGHIPGAVNLPILDNEERHIVGLTYKQEGNEKAVQKGFELVGKKFSDYISEAKKLALNKNIMVYCWRGGMRSNIMSWLLNLSGLHVTLLNGGYKSYRHWCLEELALPRKWIVLGGKTGVGKTEILLHLKTIGKHVVDLEGTAHHKGSAFGALGQKEQPTNEHFENLLALDISKFPPDIPIWIEDESPRIGAIKVPDALYAQMRRSITVAISRDVSIRRERILAEYGIFPVEVLAERTTQLKKRLGGDRLKIALEHLEQNNVAGWMEIMFLYYDKAYEHGIANHHEDEVIHFDFGHKISTQIAEELSLWQSEYFSK
jgi:tRNA 2-selenouridine synthase